MTPNEYCIRFVCFVPLDWSGTPFFGFQQFMAGLALMVLAWNIVDPRYRFRTQVAPLPLRRITFWVVVAIGLLTLFTDLWRLEHWYVLRGNIFPPPRWQALLALSYLLTFLTWAWYAFMRPANFTKRNAERFASVLYRAIVKGAPSELAVIADELTFAAVSIIHYAPDWDTPRNRKPQGEGVERPKLTETEEIAHDVLLIIANPRFCRTVVETSSATAIALFEAVKESKKYGVGIGIFARNILNEAIANKDSLIYTEAAGYESGFVGYQKPLMQAMFSNYEMVEAIDDALEPSLSRMWKWDSEQWEAYCRAVLMTFEAYVLKGMPNHSPVLYRAKGYIENSVQDLYQINASPNGSESEQSKRLRIVVRFFKDAIRILNDKDTSRPRLRMPKQRVLGTFYDHLAEGIAEVVFHAGTVQSPGELSWRIQHNAIWSDLFSYDDAERRPSRIVQFKLRRLLYNDVAEMTKFPNYKGARVLGFCLHVFGFTVPKEAHYRSSRALQIAVLRWTKKNFARIYAYDPKIAEACLVEGFTYEPDKLRLVRAHESGMKRVKKVYYFEVDPPPAGEILDD